MINSLSLITIFLTEGHYTFRIVLAQNCHGQHGEGLQGLIPPLTDSIFLRNNIAALPCSIKFGLKGKVTIANRQFDGQMPPNDLASIEIAEVLTYVTNSFGSKAGIIAATQVDGDLATCK